MADVDKFGQLPLPINNTKKARDFLKTNIFQFPWKTLIFSIFIDWVFKNEIQSTFMRAVTQSWRIWQHWGKSWLFPQGNPFLRNVYRTDRSLSSFVLSPLRCFARFQKHRWHVDFKMFCFPFLTKTQFSANGVKTLECHGTGSPCQVLSTNTHKALPRFDINDGTSSPDPKLL